MSLNSTTTYGRDSFKEIMPDVFGDIFVGNGIDLTTVSYDVFIDKHEQFDINALFILCLSYNNSLISKR